MKGIELLRPPWEDRGIKVSLITEKDNWRLIWPEIDTSIDVCQAAADYYVLEALSSGVAFPILGKKLKPFRINPSSDTEFFSKFKIKTKAERNKMLAMREERIARRLEEDPLFKVRMLMGESLIKLEEHVERIDRTFRAYGHMACAGELRHHRAIGGRVLNGNDRASAWCGWRKVYDTVGPDALLDAATIFYDFGEGNTSYGGKKWAVCAETVHARETGKLGPDGPDGIVNKRMFIDRMFTLEHNGGSFLNKIRWTVANKKGWNVDHSKQLLNAHASNPTNWRVLLGVASDEVVEHFETVLNSVNEHLEKSGCETFAMDDFLGKTWYYCRSCGADITKGHRMVCRYAVNGTISTGGISYEAEHEWQLPQSFKLPEDVLAFTKDGVLKDAWKDSECQVRISMEIYWQPGDGGWMKTSNHTTTKKGTLKDVKNWVLEWDRYGKKQKEKGWTISEAKAVFTMSLAGEKVTAPVDYFYAENGKLENVSVLDTFNKYNPNMAAALGLHGQD